MAAKDTEGASAFDAAPHVQAALRDYHLDPRIGARPLSATRACVVPPHSSATCASRAQTIAQSPV
jgi:hypothetical protein